MKYIVLKADDILIPVIFPNFMVHSEVARWVGAMLNRVHSMPNEPVSAGETHFTNVKCVGKSITMGLEASPRDAAMIETYDYTHGQMSVDDFTSNFIQDAIRKAYAESSGGDEEEEE